MTSSPLAAGLEDGRAGLGSIGEAWANACAKALSGYHEVAALPAAGATVAQPSASRSAARGALPARVQRSTPAASPSGGGVSGPERRILDALAWLATVGIEPATRRQLAMVAGYHERTKGFTNGLGSLRSLGLIDYPQPGVVVATGLLFPTRRVDKPVILKAYPR